MFGVVVTKKATKIASTMNCLAYYNGAYTPSETSVQRKTVAMSEEISEIEHIMSTRSSGVSFSIDISDITRSDETILSPAKVGPQELLSKTIAISDTRKAIGVMLLTMNAIKVLECIYNLALRCLIYYGANVNVEKYAYRCSASGRNQSSRYRRK